MDKYKHIMLDIETLGTRPGSAIVQIGAAGFDLDSGKVSAPFKVNVEPHENSTMDFSTVQWWMQQSEEARKSVFGGERDAPYGGLLALGNFIIANATHDFRVWSKPSAFDVPLIEALYRQCHMNAPWPHWKTRCLRTFIDAAQLTREEEVTPTLPHDAGEDAVAQAFTAIKCHERLRHELAG